MYATPTQAVIEDGISQGDVIQTRKVTRWLVGPEFSLSEIYTAPKGQQFVFLYLGYEPKDGSKVLDVIQVMKNMGWTPPPEIEAAHQRRLALSADTTK